MDRVRIRNRATYFPVALGDIVIAAPIVSRLLLRTTLPGRILSAAAAGAYLGSALEDWVSRRHVKRIDFHAAFGAELRGAAPMSAEARARDIGELIERLNDHYRPLRTSRRALATQVNARLTDYIAGLTGQRVETSAEVRNFMVVQLVFPFALGGCDVLSGDVAIFGDAGLFEPHVLAHEFSHRKGYLKELDAQALAYFALVGSGEGVLVQSALCERLYRQMAVVAAGDAEHYHAAVEASGLRAELKAAFRARQPTLSAYERVLGSAMRTVYDVRMRVTGQTGLSDYDEGFTNFLHATEETAGAGGRAGGQPV